MMKKTKLGKFCFDVSSLSDEQQKALAKDFKKSVDSFNKKIRSEKSE